MTDHRHQSESDEATRDKESSPIGVAPDLKQAADEQGGTTDPDEIEETDDPRH